jgi:hypothetical protein
MTTHCFTSASLNYLAKARVLGRSLKKFHPEWRLSICVTDREPPGFEFDLLNEPFDEVIWSHELPIEQPLSWLFQHDIVEACTAVKGVALANLFGRGASKVFYLDPDTAVFGSLEPLVKLLDEHSVLLTPHQLVPESTAQAIIDNEICSLSHGTYNLGFLGVRNDVSGRAMANWWRDRLLNYCTDEKDLGIFVDQKWCDLVPAMFDGVHILRDPGCNVASWNLSNRRLTFDSAGNGLVNGQPLRFFHFTKLGPIGDVMTRKSARDNTEVYELWAWYRNAVHEMTPTGIPRNWWYYGKFQNGAEIPKFARRLYRKSEDLQHSFPNPFCTNGVSFFQWLADKGHIS